MILIEDKSQEQSIQDGLCPNCRNPLDTLHHHMPDGLMGTSEYETLDYGCKNCRAAFFYTDAIGFFVLDEEEREAQLRKVAKRKERIEFLRSL